MSSERLPKTDAEVELLKPAISKLLRAIPESWAEFNFDSLTAIDDHALFLLVAAGMVERRGWVRSSIANHPTCFEFQFQATGEAGYVAVMDQVCAIEYQTWADSWRAWKSGETGHVSPFRSEVIEPQEWRLTDQGVLARDRLDVDSDEVTNYVLQCGFYGPGYWFLMRWAKPSFFMENVPLIQQLSEAYGMEWTELPRPPVGGAGLLLTIRTSCAPSEPQSVNVANWGDGGDVLVEKFSTILESLFDRMNPNGADNKTDNGKKTRKNPVPENPEVSRLAKYIKQQWKRRPNDSKESLALEFTDGDAKKTDNLLRQLRRFPHLLD